MRSRARAQRQVKHSNYPVNQDVTNEEHLLRQKELQILQLEKEDKQEEAITTERSASVPKRAGVPPINTDTPVSQTRSTGTEGTAHRWP
jgi:hypothetical protein